MRIVPAFSNDRPCPEPRRWASGVASLDAALSGGLAQGCVHEIYAAQPGDAAAAAGFVLAVATGMGGRDKAVLWLRLHRSMRMAGVLQGNGWAELGGLPDNGLLGVVDDVRTLLRTAGDALRCASLGAVIVEGWGAMRELDLTASRRLVLAAEKSGVPLLLLRIDAVPVPSAGRTRWQVAAAPSRALPGNAPGWPAFAVTLLRQRSGPCGLDWRLEWNRDRCQFDEAPLSGAVVSLSAGRAAADRTGATPWPDVRRAG
ncbi:MAG: hypothetical protein JSR96_13075 [Proteobacteria bacterium]|nr:hypothetical protein [Pseudomonadota bacterium]